MTVLQKHLQAIKSEIASLRGWLDYLERDLENDKGVIAAVVTTSISESCMKLTYNAGIANGALLGSEDSAHIDSVEIAKEVQRRCPNSQQAFGAARVVTALETLNRRASEGSNAN